MSEIIENGDPLYDRIMKAWWREGRPATIQLGNTVYRDIGDQKFVALRVNESGQGMESSYGHQSMGYQDNRRIDQSANVIIEAQQRALPPVIIEPENPDKTKTP